MSTELEFIFSGLTALEIENKLRPIIDAALFQKYGDTPDELIVKRIAEEWAAMRRTNVIYDVAVLYELTVWLKRNRYPYWMRSCSGSSFILYLLNITEGNPLSPHYYCPKCKSIQWQNTYADGFDLPPDARCPNDDTQLLSDGHEIPWQMLWGYGEHTPVFDMDLSRTLYQEIQSEWIFRRMQHLKQENAPNNPYNGKRKCIKLSNLSLMFHLEYEEISPAFYSREYTSADREYMLCHWDLLVNGEADFTNELPKPDSIADLISLFGLSHSTGAWDEATAYMIDKMGYSPVDMIAYRDDVYRYLSDHGFPEKDAWYGMDHIRKGLKLPVLTDEMVQARDKWVLSRCEKIKYLFPKAHAVEYLFFMLKSLY